MATRLEVRLAGLLVKGAAGQGRRCLQKVMPKQVKRQVPVASQHAQRCGHVPLHSKS